MLRKRLFRMKISNFEKECGKQRRAGNLPLAVVELLRISGVCGVSATCPNGAREIDAIEGAVARLGYSPWEWCSRGR